MGKLLQWLLALFLIPVSLGYSLAFYHLLVGLRQARAPELLILLGITAYLAVHAFVGVPKRFYVLGHEFMHAVATWISGGAVKGFHVGAESGSVETTKSNSFVALAPYLIPIYAVLWVLGFGVAQLFGDVTPWMRIFFFGLGFTFAFHLVFTVNVLKTKQSDLEVTGPFLSLGIIYWVNLALVVGVMSWVIPEVSFKAYLAEGLQEALHLCQLVFHQLFAA